MAMPAGTPLLFLHGTPGSRLKFAIGHDAGRELGLALIAPDRWGYGLSDVPGTPSLPAFAADMAALMDHLGHRRFAVGGISGGGPYAAAVAACLAPRVTRARARQSGWADRRCRLCRVAVRALHRFSFTVLPSLPALTAGIFGIFRWSLVRSPHLAGRLATLRGGPQRQGADRPAQICRAAARELPRGLAAGHAGPGHGPRPVLAAAGASTLAAIVAPARLWIGTADTAVPLVAARALAQRIARLLMRGAARARAISGWPPTTRACSSGSPRRCARTTVEA